MASLDDFSPQSQASLDDFQIEAPLVPVSNKPSNVNLAAYTASLSENPESVEATYLRTADSLDRGDSREVVQQLRDRARSFAMEAERKAMADILTDPDISDEAKQSAADAFLDANSSLYNVRNIASAEALIADVNDETEESSDARINVADRLQDINEYHRERQIRLNRELASQDPSMLEVGAGFLEIMAPYAEQTISANTLSEIRDGDKGAYLEAFTLLGSSKEEFANTLSRVPPSERGMVIEKIIDAVNNNSSIVFPDENDFVRLDFLRTALEEGYYGTGDKWIDNAISILELAGLPVAVTSFVRQGRRLSRLAKASRQASETGLETPAATRTDEAFAATATDEELRAAEDAAEAENADRRLRAEEDASEARIRARQQALRDDPVRRAEDAAERRAEARRAVQADDDSLRRLEDEQEARIRQTRSDVRPVTVSQNYRNTNPTKARAAHELAATDRTGQASQALYGTTRAEAVAHDSLPEVARANDSVMNKVSLPDAPVITGPQKANARVMDVADTNGALYLTDAEKVATATRIINDFNNVMGLVTRNEMSVPKASAIGGKVDIDVTYGPRDNGWASGKDAFEKVKNSLRHYGVRDSDLTLLRRDGDDYVPAKVEDAEEGGDFLVKVNYPANLDAGSIEDWNDLDVLYNFFDRLPAVFGGRMGSFQRHILDAHSMLHPTITLGANVSVDRASQLEKVLLELTKSFTDKYNDLSRVSQAAVEKEIKRANKEGKNRSTVSLKADGLGDEEVAALQSWKEVWDTMYWLENADLVKSLRNRRYELLEDPSGNTRLFAKPIPRNVAGSHKRAYDPETGQMVNLQKEDLTDLYEKGGTIATLRTKLVIDPEEAAEFVISRNQPGGPFLRKLRDDDQVLNYREGYYTVYYDAPKFIDKVVKDSKGNVIKRGAVATAQDTVTAARFQKRFQKEADEGVEYVVRDNRERMRFDGDDNWSLQEASGRTAQRVRGERLEDATSPITDEAHNHVLGPVDSLIRSARNVSNRVPMRDYLEATKTRAIKQYGHMFPKNDVTKQPEFPRSTNDIKADEGFGKEAADARTVVEYVNSLEHGYINAVDDGMKFMLRAVADAAGKTGFSMAERALNATADLGGPTRLARGVAFTLYLALNPIRQFIVQSHQAVQLFALNPRYMSKQVAPDMAAIIEHKIRGDINPWTVQASGRTKEELVAMAEAYDRSGLAASIDKSNLVRGSLSEIADATAAGGYRKSALNRAVGLASQGIAASRKAGFDIGEEVNILSSWLAHHDIASRKKKGVKLSDSELDRVTAMARSYTYNMNRAGDMPYNENALGMIFQFMQVPHKSFLQMTTNRNLTKVQKARLATFNLAMYGGLPGSVLTAYLGPWLPEDGPLRETLLQGMEGMILNKLASVMYGEDVAIDFSSLAAVDNSGLLEFIGGLWTTDVGKIIAESPAGSLVFGNNPRITNFARTAAEYFHFREPKDGSIATASELGKSFLELSSGGAGFSKVFLARATDTYAKKYNSSGGVTDTEVNTPERFAALAGFRTLDEARSFWVSQELYQSRKEHDEDVKEWYRLTKQELAREGITNDQRDFALRALSVASEQFRDDPRAYDIIRQQLQFDVRDGDLSLFNSVLRSAEWMEPDKLLEVINNSTMTDEQKQQGRDTVEFLRKYREED